LFRFAILAVVKLRYLNTSNSESLLLGRFGNRIPVEARFSAPVQIGPGTLPTSYAMGTGSFPEIKRTGCGVNYPLLSRAKIKELELHLHLHFHSVPSLQTYKMNFTFIYCINTIFGRYYSIHLGTRYCLP
jgi:hypothetical protein